MADVERKKFLSLDGISREEAKKCWPNSPAMHTSDRLDVEALAADIERQYDELSQRYPKSAAKMLAPAGPRRPDVARAKLGRMCHNGQDQTARIGHETIGA